MEKVGLAVKRKPDLGTDGRDLPGCGHFLAEPEALRQKQEAFRKSLRLFSRIALPGARWRGSGPWSRLLKRVLGAGETFFGKNADFC